MEKVCIVQDVDELDGENKMTLVGYEFGRQALGGRYDDGDLFAQRRSLVGVDVCRRGCEQDAESIEELVVLGGGFPEAVVSETLKVTLESVPVNWKWSVWVSLDVGDDGNGVPEEGVVVGGVDAGSELVEDVLHHDDKAKLGEHRLGAFSFHLVDGHDDNRTLTDIDIDDQPSHIPC